MTRTSDVPFYGRATVYVVTGEGEDTTVARVKATNRPEGMRGPTIVVTRGPSQAHVVVSYAEFDRLYGATEREALQKSTLDLMQRLVDLGRESNRRKRDLLAVLEMTRVADAGEATQDS